MTRIRSCDSRSSPLGFLGHGVEFHDFRHLGQGKRRLPIGRGFGGISTTFD